MIITILRYIVKYLHDSLGSWMILFKFLNPNIKFIILFQKTDIPLYIINLPKFDVLFNNYVCKFNQRWLTCVNGDVTHFIFYT